MPSTKQRILPSKINTIAGRILRQYRIDGLTWYPLFDLVPLLETSRNSAQIARSMPAGLVRKVQVTQRPATNMINGAGLLYMIDKAPNATVEGTRTHALAQWAQKHIVIEEGLSLSQQIIALQGEIRGYRDKFEQSARYLESLVARYEAEQGRPPAGLKADRRFKTGFRKTTS